MNKKLSIFLLLFMFSAFGLFAQNSIINLSPKTVQQLNGTQLQNYQKVQSHNIYKQLYLVETVTIPDIEQGSFIYLSLPFLDCQNLRFSAINVERVDERNISWSGRMNRDPDSNCAYGDITLQLNDNRIIGNITIADRSFELYDLTGDVQVLAETDLSKFDETECASTYALKIPFEIPIPKECENVKTKVLVLYTPAAVAIHPDILGAANLAISQINSSFWNSGVSNSVSLAGIEPLSFTQTSNPTNDVNNLAANTTAQSLRNTYKAEIVVLLTAPTYGGVNSIVKDIGGVKANAYCLVSVTTATNGRRTFAHEVGHIFGARHYNDPTDIPHRGHTFNTGGFLGMFTTKRYTMMAVMPSGKNKIDHFSNPSKEFSGKATGTSDRNNAAKLNAMKNYVAAFYADPALPPTVTVTNTFIPNCQTSGTASASLKCAQNHFGPFTYKWFTITAGTTGWVEVGTGITIPTFIPMAPGYTSQPYKVEVRNVFGGLVATATKWINRYCGDFTIPDPFNPYYYAMSFSIQEIKENQLNIYPNPAQHTATFKISSLEEDNISIDIYDINGKHIGNVHNGNISKGTSYINIDIANYPAANYIIRATGRSYNQTQKLTVL